MIDMELKILNDTQEEPVIVPELDVNENSIFK